MNSGLRNFVYSQRSGVLIQYILAETTEINWIIFFFQFSHLSVKFKHILLM